MRAEAQAHVDQINAATALLRRFLDFSEKAARKAGLTPRQHQALLVIKGYRGGDPISVGDLAERLIIHHHSAVELTNRLVESGLVVRLQDENDQRRVLLGMTERANECLEELSGGHEATTCGVEKIGFVCPRVARCARLIR